MSEQTTRELIAEKIRCAGIEYKRLNDPNWRDKPYVDGIIMDLDEDDELGFLADAVFLMLRRDGHEMEPTE